MNATRTGHRLRSVVSALIAHGCLYGELLQVEWEEEKSRLLSMFLAAFLGFIFLFCSLLSISALLLIFSWNTPYRMLTILGLIGFYSIGAGFAFYRLRVLSSRSYLAFADSREELAADIALIRNKLDK